MAAKELDALWDNWMTTMSESYGKTLDLMKDGKVKEAHEEYFMRFLPSAKKIFSEAPQTYPVRFSKIDDWCSWVKVLYVNSARTEKTLAGGDAAKANTELASLREHFYKLHQETQTLGANDYIYASRAAAAKEAPAADDLKALRQSLDSAKPSMKTKAKPDDFTKARTEWAAKVDPILQDGKIDPAELETLRAATESLYHDFGVQFE